MGKLSDAESGKHRNHFEFNVPKRPFLATQIGNDLASKRPSNDTDLETKIVPNTAAPVDTDGEELTVSLPTKIVNQTICVATAIPLTQFWNQRTYANGRSYRHRSEAKDCAYRTLVPRGRN